MIYEFLSTDYVSEVLEEHCSGRVNHRLLIWSFFILIIDQTLVLAASRYGLPIQPIIPYGAIAVGLFFAAVWIERGISPLKDANGKVVGASTVALDISKRKKEEAEWLRLIRELTEALAHVKTLSGLLPICASCKKIRDDQGYWQQVETYISAHSDADFTHGICPDCVKRLYPEYPIKPAEVTTARY